MDTSPPLLRDQRKTDAEHLRVLVICHHIAAGLSVLGAAFLTVHYMVMRTIFTNPKIMHAPNSPPAEFIGLFKWFYLFEGSASSAIW